MGALMSDLMSRVAAAALEDPSLRDLVMPSLREAFEHASPAARGKYLREHPKAEPSRHTLKGDPKPKGEKKDEAPAKSQGKKDEAEGKPSAPADKADAKQTPRGKTKAKQTPALKKLLTQSSLETSDADSVLDWKKRKPSQGQKLSDAQMLARFLRFAKPETKERMKGMSPADFMKIYSVLVDDEEGDVEGGKQASLVHRTAAAAMNDPSLRDLLVPLLRG
jgi:hypothetical protein